MQVKTVIIQMADVKSIIIKMSDASEHDQDVAIFIFAKGAYARLMTSTVMRPPPQETSAYAPFLNNSFCHFQPRNIIERSDAQNETPSTDLMPKTTN